MKIIIDKHVSDYDQIKRTWKERLFSRPWRPWVSKKSVHNPKIYRAGDTIICSPKTEANIRSAQKNSSPMGWSDSKPLYPGYYCPKLDLSYDDVHDFDR